MVSAELVEEGEMKKLWGSPWLEEGEEQHMGRTECESGGTCRQCVEDQTKNRVCLPKTNDVARQIDRKARGAREVNDEHIERSNAD